MSDEELIARLGEIQGQAGLFASAAAARIEQLVATNEALTEQLAAARRDAEEAEAYAAELEDKLAKALEEAEKYKHAFAAQSRKLQAVLHIEGVKATLAEIKGEGHE